MSSRIAGQARGPIAEPASRQAWVGVLACLCTTLLGLGLARFAYTPMIPALVRAQWFTGRDADFLGAANLAGYLLGALAAAPAARMLGVRAALRLAMIAATASLFACIMQLGFGWFFAWRLLSGIAGAVLMVLAAPRVLPMLPERLRGRAGGVIFLGLGLGMVLSGSVLPLLLRLGVRAAWEGIALAGLALTVLAWFALPPDVPATATRRGTAGLSKASASLFAAYMANAAGQVPAVLFLTEFVAQRLGQGVGAGARIWALFGVGAIAGPLLSGWLADRAGFPLALRALWVTQVVAYVALACWPHMVAVVPASILAGAGIPAAVVLVFGRSQILAEPTAEAKRRAWSLATSGFALSQAIAGYGMSFLLSATEVFWPSFALGAAFMALAYVFTAYSDRAFES